MSSVPAPDAPLARVRLDKWLWAARFFKTRSAAAQAVDGGKIDVNAERAKRAHGVQVGETVTVRRPPYEETAASREAREKLAYQLKNAPTLTFHGVGRPTKRDRREIERLKNRW